jgi:hypothetical protein
MFEMTEDLKTKLVNGDDESMMMARARHRRDRIALIEADKLKAPHRVVPAAAAMIPCDATVRPYAFVVLEYTGK